ncbi:5'-methylthioadenosine/adenosylhomocysteine nucleosidase [Alkalicoccus chagannorensis]|uniref:5'-methylthioadenosine/adenosylhomocysteine nucleosidase n=1 Tax=Alkalicoccus chagannorensis TaxID=427072 RepID=UPI00041401B0|nr:5'-methylthioadenosine/adenosylhomocysteine nucleosidase [Alkalicoccus chagannorensis]
MKFGIIGAMEEEIAHFSHVFDLAERHHVGIHRYAEGRCGVHEVVLTRAGIGKVNAAAAAQTMIQLFDVDVIFFTGAAGAANPEYEIGDIVFSTSCQQHDMNAAPLGFEPGEIPMFEGPSDFPSDAAWIARFRKAASEREDITWHAGKIVSGDQFIADKETAALLRDQFGADCIEMEGAAAAQIAWMYSIPYVVLRAVSDKANGEAPESFQQWLYEAAEKSSSLVAEVILQYSSEH